MKHLSIGDSISYDTAITIGKFDGIHLGHRLLIDSVKEKSSSMKLKSAIFSFKLDEKLGYGSNNNGVISTSDERYKLLEELMLDYFVEYPMIKDVMSLSPREFIEEILVKRLRVKHLSVGKDFRFGYNRSGDCELLDKLKDEYGYTLKVFEKLKINGETISSSAIRDKLSKGQIEDANEMLGYKYGYDGIVESGNHIGNKIGFPTMNISIARNKLIPPKGVYITNVIIDENSYYGITNIGNKPTIDINGENELGIETYIPDESIMAYNKKIRVNLIKYVRSEVKFDGLDSLKKAIASDVQELKDYIQEISR